MARAVVLYAPDGTRASRRSRRAAARLPRPGAPGLRSLRLSARPQWRALLAAGRLAHLGARSRRDRPAAAEPAAARRRALPERGEHRALTTPAWRFDGGNGDTETASTAPMASPCRACRSRGGLPRRSVRRRPGDDRPCRRRLWRALGPLGRSRARLGIAYFATGNGDDPPRGRSAYRAIEERLARHSAVQALDRLDGKATEPMRTMIATVYYYRLARAGPI